MKFLKVWFRKKEKNSNEEAVRESMHGEVNRRVSIVVKHHLSVGIRHQTTGLEDEDESDSEEAVVDIQEQDGNIKEMSVEQLVMIVKRNVGNVEEALFCLIMLAGFYGEVCEKM